MCEAKTLQYRGLLGGCNYSCPYCPFAKRRDSPNVLQADREALSGFVRRVGELDRPVSILITPYGEALIHPHYWDAMAALSRMPQVVAVGCQTNASFPLEWAEGFTAKGDPSKLRLWCSFHPGQTTVDAFTNTCLSLTALGIGISPGAVGAPKNLPQIQALRQALPPADYLWINRMDGLRRPYTREEERAFTAIDPLFPLELARPKSDPSRCTGGRSHLFIEGLGESRSCVISRDNLGALTGGQAHTPSCASSRCWCYLAYCCREDIPLLRFMGQGRLFRRFEQRVPAVFLDVDGTLTDRAGQIPATHIHAVERMAQGGRPIMLATALPFEDARRRCRSIWRWIAGGAFSNGADLRHFDSGFHKVIPVDTGIPAALSSARHRIYEAKGQPCKIILRSTRDEYGQIKPSLSHYHAVFEDGKISLTHSRATKLSGIGSLCQALSLDKAHCVVAGNGEGDAEMFSAFPLSVAVPGSDTPAVEAAALSLDLERLSRIIAFCPI